ncbi:MAG: acyltransferase family protein [Minwuia sp.]|nr:acyltransferase family protein [Minwuia sp.]
MKPTIPSAGYRPEIDGLRALAVLPVILFHAGMPGFDGGFVGVDIFFVISGFLITTIILNEKDLGRFTLSGFYARRIRRLLPALFTVMLVCLPFAWVWMTPPKLEFFGRSIVAVLLFLSNVLFWRESGYFADAAEENVLLHTWSLAVEEQYYMLFPLFMVAVWRFGLRGLLFLLIAGLVVSLGLSEWAWRYQPAANFYLAPTRAFELLAGAVGAVWTWRSGPRASNALAFIGIAMLAVSIAWLDKDDPFPSMLALIPVLGTLLVLMNATGGTMAGRILGNRLLVGVGLISYSAYLWHQPVFAFARIRFGEDADLLVLMMLVPPVLMLSWLTWWFIEVPFRRSERMRFSRVAGSLVAAFLVLGAFGVLSATSGGFPARFNLPDSVASTFTMSDREEACFAKAGAHSTDDWGCHLGPTTSPPDWMVFGDSHALAMLPAMTSIAERLNRPAFFSGASGCLPVLGIHSIRSDQRQTNCHALNQRVLEHAVAQDMKLVVLIGRWTYYTDGGYDGSEFSYVAMAEGQPKDRAMSRAAFRAGVAATAAAYRDAGIALLLIEQVPQQRRQPQDIYYRAFEDPDVAGALHDLSVSRSDHATLQQFVQSVLAEHLTTDQRLDLAPVLCGDRCPVGDTRASWYSDDDHLSVTGARRVSMAIQDQVARLLGPQGE